MKFKPNWKIAFIFCFIATIAAASGYFYLLNQAKTYTENNTASNMRSQIFLGKEYLERYLKDRKSSVDFQAIAAGMKDTLGIYVTIIKADGKVFGDSELVRGESAVDNFLGRTELQDALYSGFGASKRFNSALKKNMLSMAVPFSKEKVEGLLRFSVPLADMELFNSRLSAIAVAIIFTILLFSLIFGAVASAEITKNLKEINSGREYLDNVINSAGNPIFVKDRKHRWVLLNNAYCEFMGYARKDLIGKSDYDFFPREEADASWIKDEHVFSQGEININEEKVTDSKGVAHTIVTKKVLYKDKLGQEYIVGIITDITELKEKEDKIRRLYQTTHDILERSPLGVYVLNPDGGVDYANQAMLRMADSTYEQFKSIDASEFLGYKEPEVYSGIKSIFDGQYFCAKAARHTSFLNKKVSIRNVIGMPFDDEGREKALIFVEDITELKKLEETKVSLTHMIIHDLNSPLSVLLTELQMLKSEAGENFTAQQKEDLDIAFIATRNLQMMVGNLLDINRMEEGKIKLNRDVFILSDTAGQVVEQMKVVAHYERKNLVLEAPNSMPEISADREIIKRVIANLINNALKFSTADSSVLVKIFYKDDEDLAYVQVKDSGRGIPKEYLERIFDKFVQVETQEIRAGRGLGLTFCKMMIEAHGGEIRAHSDGMDKGAMFVFTLPMLCHSKIHGREVAASS